MSTKSVLVAGAALSVIVAALLFARAPASGDAEARTVDANNATLADESGATTTAVFAGGCFWCMEPPFEKLRGVSAVRSGYIGGTVKNPTYEQVSAGNTGHTEAVEIVYNPELVSYEQLLDLFWHNIDPLTDNAQFCDHGSQYRSEIFPRNANERTAAERSRTAIAATLKQPIVTKITDADLFYPAEEYHQDYYKKNPIRYKYYRGSCGRDARLKELWGIAAGVGTLGLIAAE